MRSSPINHDSIPGYTPKSRVLYPGIKAEFGAVVIDLVTVVWFASDSVESIWISQSASHAALGDYFARTRTRTRAPGGPDPFESIHDLLRFLVDRHPDWHRDAACKEAPPEVDFFPPRGHPVAPAVKVCETCLVRCECLKFALDRPDLGGVWGGTSEKQRRAIRRERKRRAEAA